MRQGHRLGLLMMRVRGDDRVSDPLGRVDEDPDETGELSDPARRLATQIQPDVECDLIVA